MNVELLNTWSTWLWICLRCVQFTPAFFGTHCEMQFSECTLVYLPEPYRELFSCMTMLRSYSLSEHTKSLGKESVLHIVLDKLWKYALKQSSGQGNAFSIFMWQHVHCYCRLCTWHTCQNMHCGKVQNVLPEHLKIKSNKDNSWL